jgi:deazaflavin-dependent oxidoreductase (nitroreductase family)
MNGVLRVHSALYIKSGGLIGHRILGVPCLILETTGRRSGLVRPHPLVYLRDGSDYILVASNGGSDADPTWLLNIKADPAVELRVGRTRLKGRARIVDQSDANFTRWWSLVNEKNRGRYDTYQARTKRPIPLVVVSVTP